MKMNRIWMICLRSVGVISLLILAAQFAWAEDAARGRVAVLNIMDTDVVHIHFGVTAFGDEDSHYSLPNGPLPDYIAVELKNKLKALGYDVVIVDAPLPVEDYPGFLVTKGWRDYKLTRAGREMVEKIVEREKADFVVLLEDYARSDVFQPAGASVSGHGLYTIGFIGKPRVPTSKVFGGFIGAVVTDRLKLLGTSAPPYMETVDLSSLDKDGLLRIEGSLRLFSDQVISGLVMYLDGTFQ